MHRFLVPLALVLAVLAAATTAPARRGANCARTSTGLVPLTDLGAAKYHGYRGGLYPGAKNTPSAKYLRQGIAAAKLVAPVDGKVVLLSIGMSNTTQEWSAFVQLANADSRKAANVLLVDGAQGGQDAEKTKDAAAPYWQYVAQRLRAAGATPEQVQAVWLKQAIIGGGGSYPADAKLLRDDERAIVGILAQKFPNLRLVYASSRTYGGYATTTLNPEPFAYESGFAVKWLVGDRIDGKLKGPWLGWGPYLWTDGTRGRADGFSWTCADTRASDGTHPSDSGREKIARLLLRFFTTDPTAKSWFVGS